MFHSSYLQQSKTLSLCMYCAFVANRMSFWLPVSEVALVPFMSGEGIAFPPHVGFDLASKLVRHTAAGSPHGTERVERNQEQARDMCVCVCVKRKEHPRDEMKGSMTLKPLLSPLDVCVCFCCWLPSAARLLSSSSQATEENVCFAQLQLLRKGKHYLFFYATEDLTR